MRLTGLYNVANALAAAGAARVLGIAEEAVRRGLRETSAAFGRQEVVRLEGRELWLLLAKNPAGANQVLLLLEQAGGPGMAVAGLLNDRFADGQDVSWIWDVEYELLAGRVARCWAGGDRAEDLALRLDYAGWPRPLAAAAEPGGAAGRGAGRDIAGRAGLRHPDVYGDAGPAGGAGAAGCGQERAGVALRRAR
ncbi:DUF1727 domain-containing protein [Tepidiforma flava]|uniref:DUF1727 domain-containing protein n=1 Tax=Tepidiforma flava TaxID=3004094 RepID=A0ABY7M4K2_9CHLR|nr:DUF1727 domain-containing protein [Tepidiforma flava]WBL34960.1 DUF1727 domain-containing protein [Tepidiforma flava]